MRRISKRTLLQAVAAIALISLFGIGLRRVIGWTAHERKDPRSISALASASNLGETQPVPDPSALSQEVKGAATGNAHESLVRCLRTIPGWHVVDFSDVHRFAWFHELPEYRSLVQRLREAGVDGASLLQAIKELKSTGLRQLAIFLCGDLGGREDVLELAAHLRTPDFQAVTALALGRIGGSEALTALKGAAGSDGMDFRSAKAIHQAVALLGPEGVPFLLEQARKLASKAPWDHPANFLGLISDSHCAAALKEIALGDESPAIRAMALLAYRSSSTPEAGTQWIQSLLESDQPLAVRVQAFPTAAKLNPEMVEPYLASALGDGAPSSELTIAAVKCLPLMPADAQERWLNRIVEIASMAADPAVREAAAGVLADLNSDSARKAMLAILSGTSPGRMEILRRLTSHGSQPSEVVNAVAGMLAANPENQEIRDPALAVMLRSKEVVPATREAIRQELESDSMASQLLGIRNTAMLYREGANEFLMSILNQSPLVIPRMEAISRLVLIPGNLDRPQVRACLQSAALPFLRDQLIGGIRASVVYAKGYSGQENSYAASVSILFGEFGTRDDLPLLRSAKDQVKASLAGWPESAAGSVARMVDEATARAIDCIEARP